jgi:uncharacterized protein YjbI with pentapeptide repeats
VDETWSYLEIVGQKMPRDEEKPLIPDHIPNTEDAPLVFSFVRQKTEYADFSNLTLPRVFFVRSKFASSTFFNAALIESRLCRNEFYDCDFSEADLTNCDLRASTFVICTFAKATLRNADLRHAIFKECVFTNADLTGALAGSDIPSLDCLLTRKQKRSMTWNEASGPEPDC